MCSVRVNSRPRRGDSPSACRGSAGTIDTTLGPVPDLGFVESSLARMGLQDSSLAEIGRACGMELEDIGTLWPQAVDSAFDALLLRRAGMVEDSVERVLFERSMSGIPLNRRELADLVGRAAEDAWSERAWLIITAEYAARALRHPELSKSVRRRYRHMQRNLVAIVVRWGSCTRAVAQRVVAAALGRLKNGYRTALAQ
jgi:hypothetical protein